MKPPTHFENLTAKHLRDFGPEDTLYAQKVKSGYTHTYVGRVLRYHAGLVTLQARCIEPDWAATRSDEPDVELTVRQTKCYLWGKTAKDAYPRCHWIGRGQVERDPDVPFSQCCLVPCKVVGRTTLHYECPKCGKACDALP